MAALHVAHVKGGYEMGVILIGVFLLSQFSHDRAVFISMRENQFPTRQESIIWISKELNKQQKKSKTDLRCRETQNA